MSRLVHANQLAYLENSEGMIRPPAAWPITKELRWLLMEGHLALFHLLDLESISLVAERGGRRIHLSAPGSDISFKVEVADGVVELSRKFLDDLLFEYATVESIVALMLDVADSSARMRGEWAAESPELQDAAGAERKWSGGRVLSVNSIDDIKTALATAGEYDFVATPMDLWDLVLERAGGLQAVPAALLMWQGNDREK